MVTRFALAIVLMLAAGIAAADEVEPKDNTIKKLKIERRDTLQKDVNARSAEFFAGRGTLSALTEQSKALLRAELALATKKEERVKAYKARLDLAKKMDEFNQERYEAGRVPFTDSQTSKADRLEAEIDWLEAGGEPKKEKK